MEKLGYECETEGKLLIQALNKTHNAKEVAECISVHTSTVYRLAKRMRETGSESGRYP